MQLSSRRGSTDLTHVLGALLPIGIAAAGAGEVVGSKYQACDRRFQGNLTTGMEFFDRAHADEDMTLKEKRQVARDRGAFKNCLLEQLREECPIIENELVAALEECQTWD